MRLDKLLRRGGDAQPTAEKIIIHGNAGVGKTTLPAFAPNTLFIPCRGEEAGIAKLAEYGRVPESVTWIPEIQLSNKQANDGWACLGRVVDALIEDEHPFTQVVFDCFDDEGFLEFAYRHHADEAYKGDMGDGGFMSFQRGYQTVMPCIKEFTHGKLQRLIDKGITVILLMHSGVGTYKNPQGADYTRYQPLVNQKHVWPMLQAWATMVLFLDTPVTVVGDDPAKKGKGKGGTRRVLHCEHAATHEAKNRHGLPAKLSLPSDHTQGWATFQAALKGEETQ